MSISPSKFEKIFINVSKHRTVIQFDTPAATEIYGELMTILNSSEYARVNCEVHSSNMAYVNLQRPFCIAVTARHVYYVGEVPRNILYGTIEKYNIPVRIAFNFNLNIGE